MFRWLQSLFKAPEPAGPPQLLRAFGPTEKTISDALSNEDGWRFDASEKQSFRLFELPEPSQEKCVLTYRAKVKTENLRGKTYLEMWCRLPGRGEFFSKGFHHALEGTNDWATLEAPFFLKQGQRPDLLKLNLAVEGEGSVWIKDVEILSTPLK